MLVGHLYVFNHIMECLLHKHVMCHGYDRVNIKHTRHSSQHSLTPLIQGLPARLWVTVSGYIYIYISILIYIYMYPETVTQSLAGRPWIKGVKLCCELCRVCFILTLSYPWHITCLCRRHSIIWLKTYKWPTST